MLDEVCVIKIDTFIRTQLSFWIETQMCELESRINVKYMPSVSITLISSIIEVISKVYVTNMP